MEIKTYYIENSLALTDTLTQIEEDFPCFVEREFIEQDYSEVTINAREEDFRAIEDALAPLM